MNKNSGDWKEWSQHVLAEIQRLNKNQESLNEKVEENNQILIRNTISLEEHMRRTDANERMINSVSDRLTPIETEKIEKAAVAKSRRETMMLWFKIIGSIATVGGIIAGAKPLLLLLLNVI